MDTKQILKRIETELKRRGISKSVFYKECKITSGAYSQWNTGKTTPSGRALRNIATYFGWSEEYLLTGVEKIPAYTLDGITDRELNIIMSYRALTPEQREKVESTIIGFAVANVFRQGGNEGNK